MTLKSNVLCSGKAQLRPFEPVVPGEAKEELEKRLEHEGLKAHIVAIETVDKMMDRQISAKVRERFLAYNAP